MDAVVSLDERKEAADLAHRVVSDAHYISNPAATYQTGVELYYALVDAHDTLVRGRIDEHGRFNDAVHAIVRDDSDLVHDTIRAILVSMRLRPRGVNTPQ
jgi:hypothetical protein